MTDLHGYCDKFTKKILAKKTHKYLHKKRSQNNDILSDKILGGSYYVKYQKPQDEKKDEIFDNSMIKSRLQGNILDVIKRNIEVQRNQVIPQETVIELPSGMFNLSQDVPDISLFKKPKKPVTEMQTNSFKLEKISDIQDTLKFIPQITSTPFIQHGSQNQSFNTQCTPLPISAKDLKRNNLYTDKDLKEKCDRMCRIMNIRSKFMSSILFEDMPNEIVNTKLQLQEVMINCSTCTSNDHENFNQTYVIRQHTFISNLSPSPVKFSDEPEKHDFDWLDENSQSLHENSNYDNPMVKSDNIFEMNDCVNNKIYCNFLNDNNSFF